MKTILFSLAVLSLAAITISCRAVEFNFITRGISPSDNIVSEEQPVSGITGVDMATFGRVTVQQGDRESLVIRGSDNIVPLVETSVSDGVLVIGMKEDVNIRNLNKENVLSFTVTVKDLDSLTVSGLGTVEMDALTTDSLDVVMSGAGKITIPQLGVKRLYLTVSGLGDIELAGTATQANITISGAGDVNASDLECQTVVISIPGLGNATLWVTDELSGQISGGGNIRYYGSPRMSVSTTGLGKFESLGGK